MFRTTKGANSTWRTPQPGEHLTSNGDGHLIEKRVKYGTSASLLGEGLELPSSGSDHSEQAAIDVFYDASTPP